jgi:hypothetical protein
MNGKVQKGRSRSTKHQKGVRLRIFQQNWKAKGNQPIGYPIDKDPDRHCSVTRIEWKDFRNAGE